MWCTHVAAEIDTNKIFWCHNGIIPETLFTYHCSCLRLGWIWNLIFQQPANSVSRDEAGNNGSSSDMWRVWTHTCFSAASAATQAVCSQHRRKMSVFIGRCLTVGEARRIRAPSVVRASKFRVHLLCFCVVHKWRKVQGVLLKRLCSHRSNVFSS